MQVKVNITESKTYTKTFEMTEEEFQEFMEESDDYESAFDYGLDDIDVTCDNMENIEISKQNTDGSWTRAYP